MLKSEIDQQSLPCPPFQGPSFPDQCRSLPRTAMLTACDEYRLFRMKPVQWYLPLWLLFARGMEKMKSVWENFRDVLLWKNVTLYRGQPFQLWHLSTMGSPSWKSRRGVCSSSQSGRQTWREGSEAERQGSCRLGLSATFPREGRRMSARGADDAPWQT